MKFNYCDALQEAYSQLLWQTIPPSPDEELPEISKNTTFNIFLVTIRLFLEILGNLRDIYVGFSLAVGIVTLWAISYAFRCSLVKDIRLRENILTMSRINYFKHYQTISKLSRMFSKGHGYSLLSYCLWNTLYYSIGLDRLFIPTMHWGERFYEMECAFISLLLNFALGAMFSYHVYM